MDSLLSLICEQSYILLECCFCQLSTKDKQIRRIPITDYKLSFEHGCFFIEDDCIRARFVEIKSSTVYI